MTDSGAGFDMLMSLAAQAKSGELRLDPDVAVDCAAACKEALAVLQDERTRMERQTMALPLGNFSCGHELSDILSGTTKQYVERLNEHIDCLKAIHDMVGAQVAETLTTDDETAQALARVNGQVD